MSNLNDGKQAKVNKVQLTYDDAIHSLQVSYQGTLQSQLSGIVFNSINVHCAPVPAAAAWDDGKHAKVNKVQLTYDDVIRSIQVTYEGTVQSQRRGSLGPQSAEFTLGPDEYITSLTAYGKTSSSEAVITGLTFTTNKDAYGPYGKKTSFKISALQVTGQQIAGFLGTSGNVLNFINVHYAPVPAAAAWDDGKHEKVNKVQITYDDVINSIEVTYQGSLQSQRRGSLGTQPAEFTLEPDEYITALNAYGKTLGSQEVIAGLTFTTNKNTHGPYGNKTNFQISAPAATGQQIAGFHGTSGNVLNSIDVHYAPVPTTPPKKLEAKGSETGAVWDDGARDNVKKFYVGQGHDGIAAVKFDYANGSEVVFGKEHGKKTFLGFEEFALESDEFITSVEGTYDKIFGPDSAVVTMLMFKTNKDRTVGPLGIEGSTPFTLKEEGWKIVGFHGRAGESINAIGAYLAPVGTIPLVPATPA